MRKTILNTIRFTLALSGTLIVLELFVFHAGISRKSEVFFSKDIGKMYTPNYGYTWFSEGFSMGEINKGGYLGPFYKKEKEANIKRVALLGDSYVEGFQVFGRSHFRTILEQQLNSSLIDSIEVLNFGRSNFNFPNMYAYHALVAEDYQPDLTIYFVSREDLTSLTTDVLLPNVSPMSIEVVPFLSNESAASFTKANNILSKSSLAYMLNSARRSVQNQGMINVAFDGKFSSRKKPEDKEEAIQPINLKLFEKINKDDVIFVYREKTRLPKNLKIDIENAGLDLIDLSYLLSDLEKSGDDPNFWFNQDSDGHWNIIGHKAVGTYLTSAVSSRLD